jgi:hypothetical protein
VRYVSERGKLYANLADTGFRRGEELRILVAKRSLAFIQYMSRGRRAASGNWMFVWVEVKQLVIQRKTLVQILLSLFSAAVFGTKTSAP